MSDVVREVREAFEQGRPPSRSAVAAIADAARQVFECSDQARGRRILFGRLLGIGAMPTMAGAERAPTPNSVKPEAAESALSEFIAAYAEGRTPSDAAVALIAAAAKVLHYPGKARERQERFGRAVGIGAANPASRPRNTDSRRWGEVHERVLFMVLKEREWIARGNKPRIARNRAVISAVKEFNEKQETLRRLRKKYEARVTAELNEASAYDAM